MGLFSRKKKSTISIQTTKKDSFSGWMKCSGCQEMIHLNELENTLNCCPKCNYHYRFTVDQRIAQLSDAGTFKELFSHFQSIDPLQFSDTESYSERLVSAEQKSGKTEAIITGTCEIEGLPTALAVMDFSFMGGSMGSVVGERLTCLIELAIKDELPLVCVCASGGARMQESIHSLMQMAKTSAALSKLQEAGLPYISILTNPTTGGVTASFATLGDLIFAEPEALICFAGPRVVEQTIGQTLPEGAQRSEFLLKHGMIDAIIKRRDLKPKIAQCLHLLTGNARNYKENRENLEHLLHRQSQANPSQPKTTKTPSKKWSFTF